MIITVLLLSIAFIALVIGTITDLKTREVPDWLNYSLVFIGLGLRGIYAAFSSDWMFFAYGLAGLAVFAAIAYVMFYSGQWGGGDAKMIIGLGALIGLQFTFTPLPLSIVFLINFIIFGAIYGIVWMSALVIKHRKEFWLDFYGRIHNEGIEKLRKIILVSTIVLVVLDLLLVRDIIIKILIFILIAAGYLLFYVILVTKSIEKTTLIKAVLPEKITEGDWIAKDVVVGGKRICGPKDLGISKEQIKKLIALKKAGKIKRIMVKYGIPFVPSFLIAYVVTILLGAWWMHLI